MKYTLTILILIVFTTNVFSQECDETTRARMIKSGISDKIIEEQCGKIDNEDNVIVSNVNVDDKNMDSIRLALGAAYGKFKYTNSDNTALSGVFDHDLEGGALKVSYIKVNYNDLIYGGGLSIVSVNGPEVSSVNKRTGYYTYYNSYYGNFDVYLKVKHFASSFLYGLIGYDIELGDGFSFQPTARIGQKSIEASYLVTIESQNYSNLETLYREDTSEFGFEIDFPFMYKINDSYGIGGNFCLCRSHLKVTDDAERYDFTSINAYNLLFEFYQ